MTTISHDGRLTFSRIRVIQKVEQHLSALPTIGSWTRAHKEDTKGVWAIIKPFIKHPTGTRVILTRERDNDVSSRIAAEAIVRLYDKVVQAREDNSSHPYYATAFVYPLKLLFRSFLGTRSPTEERALRFLWNFWDLLLNRLIRHIPYDHPLQDRMLCLLEHLRRHEGYILHSIRGPDKVCGARPESPLNTNEQIPLN